MPRTNEQNQAIKDQRKTKILNRSLELFASKGFTNTTIDDITNACGCSHGLFYHYFKDRDDVFVSLTQSIKEKVFDPAVTELDEVNEKEGGYEAMKVFFRRCIDYSTSTDHDAFSVLLIALVSFTKKDIPDGVAEIDIFPVLQKLVRHGQQEGKIKEGDEDAIITIFGDICVGTLYRRIINGRNGYDPLTVEDLMGLVTTK